MSEFTILRDRQDRVPVQRMAVGIQNTIIYVDGLLSPFEYVRLYLE